LIVARSAKVINALFLSTLALGSAALLASGGGHAAQITLYSSAIDAALKQVVFNRDGKYLLAGQLNSCSYAYLEHPESSLGTRWR
jgi:hypothetical protein